MPRDSESPTPSIKPAERWVKVALFATFTVVLAWLWLSSQGGGDASGSGKAPTIPTHDSADIGPPASPVPDGHNETSKSQRSSSTPKRDEVANENRASQPASTPKNQPTSRRDDDRDDSALVVHNARVTDEDKRVIYRGDVDLTNTIRRIERGKRLRFSHDGVEFENRERRLPRKPSGYYREYIHPTPDDDGPGGQRVVVGRGGEIYYTPDHYRSFKRVR